MDGLVHLMHLRTLSALTDEALESMPLKEVSEYEDIQERLGELSVEELKEDRDHFIQSCYMRQEALERLASLSTLSSAFAALEFTLTMTAENVLKLSELTSKVSDFQGQGLERAKLILRKVGGVTTAFNSAEWEKIQSYKKLRNKIMHNGGLVEKNSIDANSLAKMEHIGFIDFGDGHSFQQIHVPNFVVRSACADFETFLEKLHNEIKGGKRC
jgi:hypothetical protein